MAFPASLGAFQPASAAFCAVGPAIVIDRPATCGYTASRSGTYAAETLSWQIVIVRNNVVVFRVSSEQGSLPAGDLPTVAGDNVFATMYPSDVCHPTQFGNCYDGGIVYASDD